MLYLTMNTGKQIVFVEPDDMERLKAGMGVIAPGVPVALCYCPDPKWTSEQLQAIGTGGVGMDRLKDIVVEGAKREAAEWDRDTQAVVVRGDPAHGKHQPVPPNQETAGEAKCVAMPVGQHGVGAVTPEHDKRMAKPGLDPDIAAAYAYVDSVLPTADLMTGSQFPAWHGWGLREAFLAGCTHRENSQGT